MKKIVLLSIVLLFALNACGGAPAAGATSYIATLEGAPASARVGLVVENGRFAAYICSLDDAFNLTSARWYTGTVDENGGFQGVSSDGVALRGTIDGSTISGTVVNIEQVSMAFSGAAVAAGGPVGLYRGTGVYNGEDVLVGSVVDADGTFAATAQISDRFEFVSPIAAEPTRLSPSSIVVKIGPDEVEITVNLVTTLVTE